VTSVASPGRNAGVPPDHPWEWAITGAVVMPHLPSHGFCASLEEANAKFADDMARLPAVTWWQTLFG